ncbi:hypothetical protein [Providencia huaxiensis]|uniref:hypothetical protein n=1 Tax=Providencia TaxID=586 RepID=UPI001A19B8EC
MAIGITLLGCVKNKSEVINKESPSKSNESIEITKYNDLQICQVTDAFFMKKINVNPSSYPTYNDDLRYFKLLKNEISRRNINCYKIKDEAISKQALPLSSRQKAMRASAVCRNYAQRSRFTEPTVLFEMCVMGYKSTKEQCTKNISKFNRENEKLTGGTRAEYTEIGNAFRMGCNMN